MLGVEVHGDSPGKAGAGNAQVVQPAFDELDHLVFPAVRLNEVRVVLIQLEQPVRVFGKPEEIGLFLRPFHLASAVGAFSVLELGFSPEGFAGGTVPSLVFALIDFALVIQRAEDFLHRLFVVSVGGADEAVVADVQELPEPLESRDDPVHILLGGDALLFRIDLDFLAMLIRPGQKHHVITLKALVARDRVARHRAVAVADVRLPRRVIDGGGDIECLFVHAIIPLIKLTDSSSKRFSQNAEDRFCSSPAESGGGTETGRFY